MAHPHDDVALRPRTKAKFAASRMKVEIQPITKIPGRPGKLPVDHTGKQFGRLTAVGFVGIRKQTGKTFGNALWLCACECGDSTVVTAVSLLDGTTKSCGCLFLETIRSRAGKNALSEGESAFNQYFALYAKSARERKYQFELSKETFRGLTQMDCHYCGQEPSLKFRGGKGTNGNYTGNGVDRIDNASGYVVGNVVPCCKQCNIAKGVLPLSDFLGWVRRIHDRQYGEAV
jgi:hypothetical protein